MEDVYYIHGKIATRVGLGADLGGRGDGDTMLRGVRQQVSATLERLDAKQTARKVGGIFSPETYKEYIFEDK